MHYSGFGDGLGFRGLGVEGLGLRVIYEGLFPCSLSTKNQYAKHPLERPQLKSRGQALFETLPRWTLVGNRGLCYTGVRYGVHSLLLFKEPVSCLEGQET